MLYTAVMPQPLSKPESVLAELDRLETLLTGLEETDETLHEKVAGRLDVLRSRWSTRWSRESSRNGSAELRGNVDVGAASDEEIFNLLDNQLGLS